MKSCQYKICPFFMITSSNGNIFRVIGPLCREFTGEFPSQRTVTRSFDVFFDLRLNKRLSKQSWGWWFETPSYSLWRHCNVSVTRGLVTNNAKSALPLLKAWESICILMRRHGVIIYSRHNFTGVGKLALTSGHGRVITPHRNISV